MKTGLEKLELVTAVQLPSWVFKQLRGPSQSRCLTGTTQQPPFPRRVSVCTRDCSTLSPEPVPTPGLYPTSAVRAPPTVKVFRSFCFKKVPTRLLLKVQPWGWSQGSRALCLRTKRWRGGEGACPLRVKKYPWKEGQPNTKEVQSSYLKTKGHKRSGLSGNIRPQKHVFDFFLLFESRTKGTYKVWRRLQVKQFTKSPRTLFSPSCARGGYLETPLSPAGPSAHPCLRAACGEQLSGHKRERTFSLLEIQHLRDSLWWGHKPEHRQHTSLSTRVNQGHLRFETAQPSLSCRGRGRQWTWGRRDCERGALGGT